MNESEGPSRPLGRRAFIKAGAGAGLGAAATILPSPATAAETPLQPWWSARPSSAAANRPVAIDLHAHWVPPPYAKAMADPGRPLGNPYPLELDVDQRRKWMDEHGVQMHVLTLSGGAPWQWATPEQGGRLARIVNDAAIQAHMAFPDRFVAGIAIPVRDPKMALNELNRVAGQPGIAVPCLSSAGDISAEAGDGSRRRPHLRADHSYAAARSWQRRNRCCFVRFCCQRG